MNTLAFVEKKSYQGYEVMAEPWKRNSLKQLPLQLYKKKELDI